MCYSPRGCKELDMTEQLNNNTNNATPLSSTINHKPFGDEVPEIPCTSQKTPASLHLFLRKLKISQVVASLEISHKHNTTPITQRSVCCPQIPVLFCPFSPKSSSTNMGLTLVFPSCSFSLLMSVCDGIKYVTNS